MTLFDPSQNAPDQPMWVVVAATYNVTEAHVIAGRLLSEGIRAMVHQQAGASAMGITVGALGEVTVLVNAPDRVRALSILTHDADVDDDPAGDLTDGMTIVVPHDDQPDQ